MYNNIILCWLETWQPAAEWLVAISTLILAIIALLSIPGIRSFLFRPSLIPVDLAKTRQKIGETYFIYQRLIVKNVGRGAANSARVLLTYKKGPPKNFIPVPLAWTHWPGDSRNISINEPAYVDIVRKKEGKEDYEFCWPGTTQGASEDVLKEFDSQRGDLRLEFFEHNRQIGDVTLQYSGKNDEFEIVR